MSNLGAYAYGGIKWPPKPIPRSFAARMAFRKKYEEYLSERKGTYYTRARRYHRVADALVKLGVREGDILYDLGAGMCELDRCLREREMHLRYVPVDAAIDGTDLNSWMIEPAAVYTLVEVIEHLEYPLEFLQTLKYGVSKGIVLTTPNPKHVDVLGMCGDHKHEIHEYQLRDLDFGVKPVALYTNQPDTLVATWRNPRAQVS